MAARRRPSARAAALPARRAGFDLARIAPSGRSIALGLALLAVAVGGYLAALETSLFAVRAVEVRGGTPQLQAAVRAALRPELGRSLLRVNGSGLARLLGALPFVRTFSYDRAFPNTLKVTVRSEVPVLLVRYPRGNAYLVSASARVLAPVPNPRRSSLPRLYVPPQVRLQVGGQAPDTVAAAAAALAPLQAAPLPGGVRFVTNGPQGLTLLLRDGLEVRLGDRGDVRLKYAIARRILAATGAAQAGGGYLDVSVPERPVLSSNSQVGG